MAGGECHGVVEWRSWKRAAGDQSRLCRVYGNVDATDEPGDNAADDGSHHARDNSGHHTSHHATEFWQHHTDTASDDGDGHLRLRARFYLHDLTAWPWHPDAHPFERAVGERTHTRLAEPRTN